MQYYDIDEIKRVSDCRNYAMTVHGLRETSPGRTNCPWRAGSDSGAFAINRDGWYDHIAKEGGDIIDFEKRMRSASVIDAVAAIGKHYGLSPRKPTKGTVQGKVVAEYVYTDVDGNPIHKTVRYEPKDFRQKHWADGKWQPGLNGVTPRLYNLPNVDKAEGVIFCEGEKDCDRLNALGFVATTVAMGAGKWHDSYAELLKGKHIVILHDNDDPGVDHARLVTWQLREHAKSIRVICPSDKPGGDISDWLDDGGTPDKLRELMQGTPKTDMNDVTEPKSLKDARVRDVAKTYNDGPLKNWEWREVLQPNGQEKLVKVARRQGDIVDEMFVRFGGFPKCIGETPFAHDAQRNRVHWLKNGVDLFSWVCDESKQQPSFRKVEGCATWDSLHSSIRRNGEVYNMVSGAPHYPPREAVYYTHGQLPDPTPKNRKSYLDKFVEFFAPATPVDKHMLRAFFVSPLYYRPNRDRPLWVIDSTQGRAVGKTTVVKLCSRLYDVLLDGDSENSAGLMMVDYKSLHNNNGWEELLKRILSAEGRTKRILLLDNVVGYFKAAQLAALVTQDSVSGRPAYARGETTRPNDMTLVLTSNSATLDTDLVSRAMFVHLKRPPSSGEWNNKVADFIEAHRLQILSDALAMLESDLPFDCMPQSRFPDWERAVLMRCCKTLDEYDKVWKTLADRSKECDGEADEAGAIQDHLYQAIIDIGCDPEESILWLSHSVLVRWTKEVRPDFGGFNGANVTHKLRNFVRQGQMEYLTVEPSPRWPSHKKHRCNGMMWNGKLYLDAIRRGKDPIVTIVKQQGNEVPSKYMWGDVENGGAI